MQDPCYEPDIERMPAGQLRARHEAALAGGALRHASRSALYRDTWVESNVDVERIRKVEELSRLPYTTADMLRRAWESHPPDSIVQASRPRVWFASSGSTGTPKWTPYGAAEIAQLQRTSLRGLYMYAGQPRQGLRCLLLSTPAPFISDGVGYFNLQALIRAGLNVEHTITSYAAEDARAAMRLVSRRHVDALVAIPTIALRLGEMLAQEVPKALRRALRERPSLRGLLAVVATSLFRVKARRVLGARLGVFGGEPVPPHAPLLREMLGVEPFELYAMTEFAAFHVDCREHAGVHFWVDAVIPELIPLDELRRERDEGRLPHAVPLLDAADGATGELVLTTLGQSLPLVRYRTADLVEVVSTRRCGCGRTHPRIRVRGRRDEIIRLGLIRIGVADIEACVHEASSPSGPVEWQAVVTREGYKARLTLLLAAPTGSGTTSPAAAARRLVEVPALAAALEAGIIHEPLVRIVPAFEEAATWSGKRSRVLYRNGEVVI